jgi:gamma-glutamylcyclotransferase (GGCT)/AIG2-like uncharacterized protein YtfP
MTAVFVYGTLRSGGAAHAAILGDRVREVRPASIAGYDLYGNGLPYPFVREGAGRVHGELLEVAGGDATLAELDRYEGADYLRRRVEVETGDRRVAAWTYVARPEVDLSAESLIPSGDWLAR